MFPHSDLDLLIVCTRKTLEADERAITALLQALWDLGLSVGQQVWSWEDLEPLRLEEFELILTLLDIRFLFGNRQRSEQFTEGHLKSYLQINRDEILERLRELTGQRRESFGDTIYQLEPDIKQAPGGLRDHLSGRWVEKLQQTAVFLPFTSSEIQQAWRFMARLRIHLHYQTGRNHNQLTHRLQEKLVPFMGYGKVSTRSGVETLMKQYFLHARVISISSRRLLSAGLQERELQPLVDDASPGLAQIMDLLLTSLKGNYRIGGPAGFQIQQALPALTGYQGYPAVSIQLRELFQPRPGLYRTLSEMYELGVLEKLFPEFSQIKGRVIRDFFHKYTVDEHSLLAVKAIEDLLCGHEDPRFQTLLRETPDPEILTLSLLLHDVGKGQRGKHVETGARIALRALRRFRLAPALIESVVFLIRSHLAMSAVVLRRNLEDDEVIGRFADLVRDTTHLRLLCLLTYADMKAVAPEVLNDWKKDRLWQLYVATYNELTLAYGERRIDGGDIGDQLRRELPADLDPEGFEQFLKGFPVRYITTTPAAEIYEHYRLGQQLSPPTPVQIRLVDRQTHLELCVVTSDRYHLFARIVGLLSYFDMNIMRGYGFSNRRDTVLDFFQFTDTRGVFRLNPEEQERFEKLLYDAIENKVSVESLLAGKERSFILQSPAPNFEPVIFFDEEEDREYSIMEIIAPDSIGLLYRVSKEISALGCNIELVLISTEGEQAVDVFYLTRDERKLETGLQKTLTDNITASVGI